MVHSTAFSTIPIEKLFSIIESEYHSKHEILGIPEELFFNPENHEGLSMEIFGQKLKTPLGVAAGPHRTENHSNPR